MKTKIIILAGVLVVAGTGIFFGFKAWRAGVIVRQEQRAFTQAQRFVDQGDFESALGLIRRQPVATAKLNWPPLEVHALAGLRAAPQLAGIYQQAPQRILADEEASVVLARAYLASRNQTALKLIRKTWAGHEIRKDIWLTLDSDVLLAAGKPREAEKVLRSQKFTGKAEAARLERLSFFVAKTDLPQAWQLLSDATQLDSRNPEIRSFRAQILEAAGKPEAARIEYIAALLAETNNPLLADQLAEFYRRQDNLDAALDTWETSLTRPTFDFVALKAAFWQKFIRPGKITEDKIPNGELQPLARWVAGLNNGEFFDTNSFSALPQAHQLEQNRQETFWLRLADALQKKHEVEAAALLQFNPHRSTSWRPELETALARILHYRLKHSLNLLEILAPSGPSGDGRHQFFTQLETLAMQERTTGRITVPADLDLLLRGPSAFAAAFLAAGWREAALQLCEPAKISAGQPSWFAYGLAEALRLNRSPAAALEFLTQQKGDATLQLLAAEIKIELGNSAAGLADLVPLASQNTPAGFRASYMLALANADANRLDEARKWVLQNPQLAADLLGRELLGNLAVRKGQLAEADRIYQSIVGQSLPAKAYFAKKAIDQHNWVEARRLTSELLQLAPEDLQFRANLAMIDKQAAGK